VEGRVHCVGGKGSSAKAAVVLDETYLPPGSVGVFIDDDINEFPQLF